jgi:signal transduction histidine kinase
MIGTGKVVLTTIRDMSNWIELERQKNMSSMKTVAFASAAHEFRNPLNAIDISLEMLTPLIQDDRAKKYC